MAGRIHVGDVGTKITLDLETDLTLATAALIKYRKPSGAEGQWTATVTETTKLSYTLQEGDLDEVGLWEIQPYVELPDWKGHGSVVRFYVYPTIS